MFFPQDPQVPSKTKSIAKSCSLKVYKRIPLPMAEVSAMLDTDMEESVPNSDLISALTETKIPATKSK